jgi:hypothetical protein
MQATEFQSAGRCLNNKGSTSSTLNQLVTVPIKRSTPRLVNCQSRELQARIRSKREVDCARTVMRFQDRLAELRPTMIRYEASSWVMESSTSVPSSLTAARNASRSRRSSSEAGSAPRNEGRGRRGAIARFYPQQLIWRGYTRRSSAPASLRSRMIDIPHHEEHIRP